MDGMASKTQRGFTLLEIIFVVAVLGIITTFAVPSYLSSRMAANEGAAIGALRLISAAEVIHNERYGSYGTLDELIARGLVDPTFGNATRRGYMIDTITVNTFEYTAFADPENFGTSGERYFYIDDSGVIRQATGSPADASAPPVD